MNDRPPQSSEPPNDNRSANALRRMKDAPNATACASGSVSRWWGSRQESQLDSPWVLGALLCLVTVLVYLNSFQGVFVFDDYGDILGNESIRHLWPLKDVFCQTLAGQVHVSSRPLVNLTFALNYATGGYAPLHYHITNLVIHVLAGLALLGIVRRTLSLPSVKQHFTGAEPLLALLIALIWTLHPLQTESVTYITQRYESLMGMFALFSLYSVTRIPESLRSRIWMFLASLSCFLALICKEAAASLPLLLLLYDRAFLAGSFKEAWRKRWPLYLGLLLAWGCFAALQLFVPKRNFAGYGLGMPWWHYGISQFKVVLHYLRIAYWPHPLVLDYGWAPVTTWKEVLPGLIVIGSILAATIYALFRRSGLGFLGACFFLILAPTSSVMPILDLAVEHRMYLPLAPVVVLSILSGYWFFHWLSEKGDLIQRILRPLLSVLLASLVATLGILTYLRNDDYSSLLHFNRNNVAQAPHNPRIRYNYALALKEAGYYGEAIVQNRMAIQLSPEYWDAHQNLGILLAKIGQYDESIFHLGLAIKANPNDPKGYLNLGVAYSGSGDLESAEGCNKKVLALDSTYAEAYNNLALIRDQQGRDVEALAYIKKALALKPTNAGYLWNLGIMLYQQGKIEEAMLRLREAIKVDSEFFERRSQFGIILFMQGNSKEAIDHIRAALRTKPDHVQSLIRLAWILATSSDASVRNGTEALVAAEEAIRRLGARPTVALDTLAAALAESGRFNDAYSVMEEALRSNKDASLDEGLKRRLELYRNGKVYREMGRQGIVPKS